MSTQTEIQLHNYPNFIITTKEGTGYGIFFRSPIQKKHYDTYVFEKKSTSAWDYMAKIKNKLRYFYEFIIGNRNILKHINEWSEDDCWAGFDANYLCSPIYFKREYRYLHAQATNPDLNIQEVKSYGYEGPFNYCSGACKIERTTITLKTGKKIKLKNTERYKYTYSHIVSKIMEGNVVPLP